MTDNRFQEDEPEKKIRSRPANVEHEADLDIRKRSADLGDDAGVRLLLPVGRSGWAIAAGYLGLISVLILPAPLALLMGILAVREMRRDPTKHGMGRAIFGIIMGGVFTVPLLFALLVFIMASLGY